jgi:hypothetical protein
MAVSFAGLDLSFLKDPAKRLPEEMKVRRKHRPRGPRSDAVASPYFVPDVDAVYGGAWQSIVDGSEISSRSNWREHNKKNGVVDVGDRFWSNDGDDAKRTRELMGYDPSLINKKDDGDGISFEWQSRIKA